MSDRQTSSTQPNPLTLNLGLEQLVINRRYEVASMFNDILTGLWFVVGSCFFFFNSLQTPAIWLFLIGSLELLIRPMLRIARDVHLRRKPYSGTVPSSGNAEPNA
ncbi:MAG: YrhK family protein [Gammaproteobacteria bacterium]